MEKLFGEFSSKFFSSSKSLDWHSMGFVGKLIKKKTLLRCVSSEEDYQYIAGRINFIGMRGKALLFIAIGICLMVVKMVISLSALILFVQQPCALTFYVHSP